MNQRRRLREETPAESRSLVGARLGKYPRRSDHKEVLSTVENLMVKLSDYNSNTVKERIEHLSSLVSDSMHKYKGDILRILVECVSMHPMQSGAYATFVGLANVRDYEFGGECLNSVTQQFLKSLHDAQWDKARCMLLLLADFVNTNVVTVGSILQLLNSLAAVCEEEDAPQGRRDYYAYLVLSSLPLIGRELYEKKEAALQKLVQRVQIYVNKKRSLGAEHLRFLSICCNIEMPQHEYLELLCQQVLRLVRDNWIEQQLLRPYLAFDDALSSALQHHLPNLKPPSLQESQGVSYPRPYLIFHLFELHDCAPTLRLPDELDIERHVIESHILELFQRYHLERRTCAEIFLSYCDAKPHLALEHCITEVLLGQMLQMPSSPLLIINYGSIFIELCKLRPGKFPRVIAQAADLLYTQLDTMNVSSIDRFVNWFSHHLSNFRYDWDWQSWDSSTTVPALHPRAMFIRELLKKCMRLSYHQFIVQLVPPCLASLVPVAPAPNFKYINELLPGAKFAKTLLSVVRKKCSPEVIGGLMEATTELEDGLKINVLLQAFLHLGCKSFSHIFSIFRKFQPALQMLAHDEANQLSMLEAIFEFWSSNEQVKLVLTERLLKMQIIEADVIVKWIFGLKEELTKMYLWELLHLIIKYTKNHPKCEPQQGAHFECLLLNIFKSCFNVLSEHQSTAQLKSPDYWSNWVFGRLQAVLFNYMEDFRKISSKLSEIASEMDKSELISKIIVYLSFKE